MKSVIYKKYAMEVLSPMYVKFGHSLRYKEVETKTGLNPVKLSRVLSGLTREKFITREEISPMGTNYAITSKGVAAYESLLILAKL